MDTLGIIFSSVIGFSVWITLQKENQDKEERRRQAIARIKYIQPSNERHR